ncbi:hypothetical protein [Novosphingobium sp.]|uniref:hypothetical protein n=1 Tax=Novosphingobium sp. TaxID=1874826 RepID=UPI0038B7B597|nr:hypothetical protein [Pseudomonadota bacterium]
MDKRKSEPVELESDNPSENSRIKAATEIQSQVRPDDYPKQARAAQVAAATGLPEKPDQSRRKR